MLSLLPQESSNFWTQCKKYQNHSRKQTFFQLSTSSSTSGTILFTRRLLPLSIMHGLGLWIELRLIFSVAWEKPPKNMRSKNKFKPALKNKARCLLWVSTSQLGENWQNLARSKTKTWNAEYKYFYAVFQRVKKGFGSQEQKKAWRDANRNK